MNKDSSPRYAAVLLVGVALVLWLGLPPATLLVLVACPLMMLVMMRGMHGGGSASKDLTATPEKTPDEAAKDLSRR